MISSWIKTDWVESEQLCSFEELTDGICGVTTSWWTLFRRRPHHQRSIVQVFALKMYKYSNLAGCSILSMPCHRKALISLSKVSSQWEKLQDPHAVFRRNPERGALLCSIGAGVLIVWCLKFAETSTWSYLNKTAQGTCWLERGSPRPAKGGGVSARRHADGQPNGNRSRLGGAIAFYAVCNVCTFYMRINNELLWKKHRAKWAYREIAHFFVNNFFTCSDNVFVCFFVWIRYGQLVGGVAAALQGGLALAGFDGVVSLWCVKVWPFLTCRCFQHREPDGSSSRFQGTAR